MLKIKDNVDLKELEKFGFEKVKSFSEPYEGYWQKTYKDHDSIYLEEDTRELNISIIEDTSGIIPTTLFDLIQAGLVEKVVE